METCGFILKYNDPLDYVFYSADLFSLLLGAWFSDVRLKLKGSRFFKTVIYLPNLIMASAFSMLFLHTLFRWWSDQLSADADSDLSQNLINFYHMQEVPEA